MINYKFIRKNCDLSIRQTKIFGAVYQNKPSKFNPKKGSQ